jgi:uncharacterized protein YxeA
MQMRKMKTFAALSVLAVMVLVGGLQSVKAQENSPSREESLSWIKKAMSSNGTFKTTEAKSDRTNEYRIESFSFSGCEVSWVYTMNAKRDNRTWYVTEEISFNLSDLHPDSVKSKNPDDDFKYAEVYLHTSGGLNTINVNASGFRAEYSEPKTSVVSINIDDPLTAERIAKAFKHVIKLCGGGSKQPF